MGTSLCLLPAGSNLFALPSRQPDDGRERDKVASKSKRKICQQQQQLKVIPNVVIVVTVF